MIKAYKYGEVIRLDSFLVDMLNQGYRGMKQYGGIDAVVIVPRYKPSWRTPFPMKRIARRFCRSNGLPALLDALVKKKDTPPQVTLTGKGRLRNLKGVFAMRRGADVAGMNLLLLDDVSTTGSTLRFAAEVLHAAGARVWALAIAKAQ